MPTPALALLVLLAASPAAPAAPTAAEARAFVARANAEAKDLLTRQSTADWVRQTYITDDTERLSAWASEALMAFQSRAVPEASRLAQAKGLDAETARALYLVRTASTLPAPSDPAKRAELATLAARLDSAYGKGKWCGKDGHAPCRDLEQLSEVMRKSRSWDELLDAWYGWHTIAPAMRADYTRLVALGNEGAREIGFGDLGELWRAGYDMTPAEFAQETDRLWAQVKPLYDELHCYVRGKLQERYGKDRVPDGKPIPAHLLGNMWAQEWGNVYDLAAPPGAAASVAKLDVSGALERKGFDPVRMVKLGEGFYTSLGLDPLPASFWERSMFVKPRDREVVCHASAWDVTFSDDLRVKMCIKPTADDLVTIHHELGHDYYFQSYWRLPVIFQQGANDGFHEAIGDAIALSVTPAYLKRVGVLDELPPTDEAGLVAIQLREAMDKVAFLPFGLLIDRWRWDVFSGKTPPAQYDAAWWALRRKYQGVDAPVARSEADFDPGAKYHIPANVPYTRYFLARIYQFQFHRALCQAAGQQGPLHACSIYGNKAAGKRLHEMLALGASKPWPEAMYALTGQRQADASALLDYFAPLRSWLQAQNRGRKCGW
ncbi:M2 family metallopeptidase [Anaeromyxobacter diazotrophicus]|uniref:Peptidase M2 n=1 Tax=Anaeromyxobacter diazotrophicus TaxID=2590199 RepID=A0A7I9VQG4_9BACT|nr:M2 family metallopeptidase [Anaeromyxobacter diazotrophicus]GEJ58217.1 peptidase M2 [Anaeromyxobacter diazotrophicus]